MPALTREHWQEPALCTQSEVYPLLSFPGLFATNTNSRLCFLVQREGFAARAAVCTELAVRQEQHPLVAGGHLEPSGKSPPSSAAASGGLGCLDSKKYAFGGGLELDDSFQSKSFYSYVFSVPPSILQLLALS